MPAEISSTSFIEPETDNKYVQDSFETEKLRSNRTSPNLEDDQSQPNDIRRKGSIRFYDEGQSFEEEKRIEDTPKYTQNEFDYEKILQQKQQQQDQNYSQLEYPGSVYDKSENLFKTGQYDISQNFDTSQPIYVDQQNYNENQFGEGGLQPSSEHEYPYAQSYEQYQSNQQPSELPYQSKYTDGLYTEGAASISTFEFGKSQPTQQQQSFAQPTMEMGQKYKGNGNTASNRSMSKQPSKKKFT